MTPEHSAFPVHVFLAQQIAFATIVTLYGGLSAESRCRADADRLLLREACGWRPQAKAEAKADQPRLSDLKHIHDPTDASHLRRYSVSDKDGHDSLWATRRITPSATVQKARSQKAFALGSLRTAGIYLARFQMTSACPPVCNARAVSLS